MQTDKITVKSNGEGREKAIEEAAKFAAYTGLDKTKALRVRLLAEETLGMVEAITGDFVADFWIENEKDCAVRIHLTAYTCMDYAKKRDLIDVSSDKKNASAKGFMGKIRQLIENGMYSVDEVGSMQNELGVSMPYMDMGICDTGSVSSLSSYTYMWSLENYRHSIESHQGSGVVYEEAWDELEKSIVANIADDVRVGVRGNNVELIIEKRKF